MKNVTIFKNKVFLFLILMIGIGLSSCKKDDKPVYADPVISIKGNSEMEVKKGEPINVSFNLSAEGGNKELLVYANGGLLETVALPKDATSYVYSNQSVPDDATEGEEYNYEFSLVNTQNKESSKVELTVSTLAYDSIKVGNTSLYNIDIPEDGLVNSDIKLVSGRNYYLSSSLNFNDGTSLTIEEGVQLYLKSDAETPVGIAFNEGAKVDIEGSSVNPVVITSDKTLLGETPEPGDWDVFELNGGDKGSNSGIIKYLRLEYGNDRTFRLKSVGSGTVIDHVQVYRSAGVGIMPTNGDVNMKYVVATNCEGGGFRLGDDYSGKIQFGITHLSESYGENYAVQIRETSSPTLSNFTIIGPGQESTEETYGMRMMSASSGKVYNTVIAEFYEKGLRLNDDIVITDLTGPTVFAYSYIFNVHKQVYRDDTENGNPFQGSLDGNNVFQNPFHNNVTDIVDGDPVLLKIDSITTQDIIPMQEQPSDFDPATLGNFFTSASYVGAIKDPSDTWLNGWTRDTDGNLRQ